MREKRNFDSRRNVLPSDQPKSKYFLVFEGSQTEQIYFDAVVDHRTEIGISNLIAIVPLVRTYNEDGMSNPKVITERILQTIHEHQTGNYPYRRVIEWITDYIDSSRILTIGTKAIESIFTEIISEELSLDLNDTIGFDDLEGFIENVITLSKPFFKNKFTVLTQHAKDIIENASVFYDSTVDKICIIVDRDSKSFTESQYDEVMHTCADNGFRLIVTNPCFEFWLLLHFPDADQLDNEKLLTNEKVSKYTSYCEHELKNRMNGYRKNHYDADYLVSNVDTAIQNEQKYCEDLDMLKLSIGSNLGLLITEMRMKI